MNAKAAIAALRKKNPSGRAKAKAAAYNGKVKGFDPKSVVAALELARDRNFDVAMTAGWLVTLAVRQNAAIDEGALAKALKSSTFPDGVIEATHLLAKKGPLPKRVVEAIPWKPYGGDTRRWAARALTLHAIATDDGALGQRLLTEQHREFRAGVHIIATEATLTNPTALALLDHASKFGEYREPARKRLAAIRAAARPQKPAKVATKPAAPVKAKPVRAKKPAKRATGRRSRRPRR